MFKTPFLSIITINFNNANGLERTIESTINQTFQHFEYIVIDGGSTDGSIEVLKKFERFINHSISERDAGIYNAMNKGINIAKGAYLLFINSGDYLAYDKILEETMPLMHEEDIIYGNYLVKAPDKCWVKQYPNSLSLSHFIYDSLPHSAGAFIKKDSFKNELSMYDETLKITADWKWYVTAIFRYNYSYKHINKTIGVFDYTGISATEAALVNKEKEQVMNEEFRELYKEIALLSAYKAKYEALYGSRYIQFCLKLKNLLSWRN